MTKDIERITAEYIAGDLDSRGYQFPYDLKLEDIEAPEILWFDEDDEDAYGVSGFHAGGNAYEFSPLWYEILNQYDELDGWSVEHGGLRFENYGDPISEERVKAVLLEAHGDFLTVFKAGLK